MVSFLLGNAVFLGFHNRSCICVGLATRVVSLLRILILSHRANFVTCLERLSPILVEDLKEV